MKKKQLKKRLKKLEIHLAAAERRLAQTDQRVAGIPAFDMARVINRLDGLDGVARRHNTSIKELEAAEGRRAMAEQKILEDMAAGVAGGEDALENDAPPTVAIGEGT